MADEMAHPQVRKDLQDLYDHAYDGSEAGWRWLGALDKAQSVVSLASELAPASILEIGAGEGSVLQRLSELAFGQRLYAAEISASAVELIRQREIPRLVECTRFDGYRIPYADRQFDLVILSHVIEHVENPRLLLYEASRLGNRVLVEVPTEDNLAAEWTMGQNYRPDGVGHINFFSPRTIRLLLQTCELTVLKERVYTPSRAIHDASEQRAGTRFKLGTAKYLVKRALLASTPGLATRLLTYHCAFLCQPPAGTRAGAGPPT
jgi:SAM-dependent methyltransferase